MAKQRLSLQQFVATGKSSGSAGARIEFEDGSVWEKTGNTGAVSQYPVVDTGDSTFFDSVGEEWSFVFYNSYSQFNDYFIPPQSGNLHRQAFRVFSGSSVLAAGTDDKLDGSTFIGDPAQDVNSFYLERGAQNLSISYFGGIGQTNGSRASDRYEYLGVSVIWESGLSVTIGDQVGYSGKIYSADASGTTGSTPPTHTSGSVSDGSISWTFVSFCLGTPIADAAVSLQDVDDGTGVWSRYTENVRSAGGGTSFAEEIATKNKGGDVVNSPFNPLAGGATIGEWFAGGGDATLGAPINPSTAAIVIGKNAESWNKGIVIASDGITGTDGVTGSGDAISMAKGHRVGWWSSDGMSFYVKSNVTSSANKVAINASNNAVQFYGSTDNVIGQVEGLGTDVNSLRIRSSGTGSPVNLQAQGSDADVDVKFTPKGSGLVSFGFHTGIGAETITGYITIKDATGTERKIGVVS